ncbi:MAG: C10 family peptidase [Bacteroidetes bacterium]|nr:C10 family peptidase [Bacteroidota bacterium]
MKAFFLSTLLLLSLSAGIAARPVTTEEAQSVARTWLVSRGYPQFETARIRSCVAHSVEGEVAWHLVSFDPEGFVIVAGDDVAHPVLMYSAVGEGGDSLPSQLASLLDGAAAEITHAAGALLGARAESAALWNLLRGGGGIMSMAAGGVDPLVQTKWDQGSGYNSYCPEDPQAANGRCVAGCTAVGMAQALNYFRAPVRGSGSHSYTHPKYGKLSADFESRRYRWESMTTDEIARVIYHCGVAVDMDYGPHGSAGSLGRAKNALLHFFGFQESITLTQRDEYPDDLWKHMLQEDLDAGRPILYTGYDTSWSGHLWVVDGYKTDGYFHCNWGWGGKYDGWFYLDDLTPGSQQFNIGHWVIMHLEPKEWTQSEVSTAADLLAIDAAEDTLWACGTSGCVVRSTDGGWKWKPVSFSSQDVTLQDISVFDDSLAWVIGVDETDATSSLWRTTDGGASWITQLSVSGREGRLRSISFSDTEHGVTCGDTVNGRFRIWTTSDSGMTWHPVPPEYVPAADAGESGVFNSMSRHGSTVFAGTSRQSGSARILRSNDNGASWAAMDTHPSLGRTIRSVAAASGENAWLLDSDGRASRTTDGGVTWSVPTGTGVAEPSVLASGGGGILAAIGAAGALRYTTNGGTSWSSGMLPEAVDLNDMEMNLDGQWWIVGDGGRIFLRSRLSPHIAPPGIPLLRTPDNSAHDIPPSVTLIWEGDERAQQYEVQVATDPAFATLEYERDRITEHKAYLYGLHVNTWYYWRVRAVNIGGPSEWSETWSFLTLPGVPDMPTLLSPEDAAMGQPTEITLRWSPVDHTDRYHFKVLYRQLGQNATHVEQAWHTESSYTVTNLQPGETYSWQVRAHNALGYGSWSELWSFTTDDFTGVEPTDQRQPKKLLIVENHPEPFTDATTLHYRMERPGHIVLRVYDVLGREIRVLVSGWMPTGRHEVVFTATGLSPGMYFCRCSTDDAVAVRRLHLVR